MNTSTWKIRVPPGKNSFGSPNILVTDEATSEPPRFRLYGKKDVDSTPIVFPIEYREGFGGGKDDRPSFLGGSSGKKVESLEIQFNVQANQLPILKEWDTWAKTELMTNSKACFGRVYTKEEIDVMYQSPLREDPQQRWPPSLKAKLNLSGIQRFLTNVRVMKPDGSYEDGSGWAFVSSHLGDTKWKGCRACAVIDLRRIWSAGRRVGLNLSVTDLKVWIQDDTRHSVFDDDKEASYLAQ